MTETNPNLYKARLLNEGESPYDPKHNYGSGALSAEVAESNYQRQKNRFEQANDIRWGEKYREFVDWMRSLDPNLRSQIATWLSADLFDIILDAGCNSCTTSEQKGNILRGQMGGPYDRFNKKDGGDAA